MRTATDAGFIEMRIARVVGFGPPLAPEEFRCVVLDEVSGDRHLVIEIGAGEAFYLAAGLQGVPFGRPMTYQFAGALVHDLGGRVRQVRIDRLVDGAVAATVEIDGPLGVRRIDARASDALNLGVVTAAPVFVSPEVAADGERRRAGGSAGAGLLRLALTAPPVTVMRPQD
ncbi:MAG TPA: bifunctional nuclease family protein [Streptosporangiaceae bacterium]|jgi:bifunctional DNase/RNase